MGSNEGFARACNRAVASLDASVEVICLHNPDVDLPDGALDQLTATLRSQPHPGIAAPAEQTGGLLRLRGYHYPSVLREAISTPLPFGFADRSHAEGQPSRRTAGRPPGSHDCLSWRRQTLRSRVSRGHRSGGLGGVERVRRALLPLLRGLGLLASAGAYGRLCNRVSPGRCDVPPPPGASSSGQHVAARTGEMASGRAFLGDVPAKVLADYPRGSSTLSVASSARMPAALTLRIAGAGDRVDPALGGDVRFVCRTSPRTKPAQAPLAGGRLSNPR